MNIVRLQEAMAKLKAEDALFTNVFEHGSLSVEIYQPLNVDLQEPHDRDEVYIIADGNGIFEVEGEKMPFKKGDFLFVKAYDKHRFIEFSEDFKTWVLFYGPVGGEK